MKQIHDHQNSNFQTRRPYTWKNTTNYVRSNCIFLSYIIFLILTYLFGYFSGSSSKQNIDTIRKTPTREFISVTSTDCVPAVEKSNDHNRFSQTCGEPIQPEEVRLTLINGVFSGTSPYENFPPAHVASLLEPKRVKGWGSYGAVFETLIKKVRPQIIIEVGTFLGASATHMAELTGQLGLQTLIICVDDFRGWPGFRDKIKYVPSVNGDVLLYYQFLQNVVSLNQTESILPVPFSTGSGLGKLCEWGVLADLLEVDAGHDFHSAWSDINMAYKLLKPGGVMFGHDYFTSYDDKGVRRAVDLFAKVHGFKITTNGQHWVLDDHR